MEIWINPVCSKCSAALKALDEAGIEVEQRRYLEQAPTAAELNDVLHRLQLEPWNITRLTEQTAVELGMAQWPQDRNRWIAALAEHPILIQRPILLLDDGSATIGRTEQDLRTAIHGQHSRGEGRHRS